VFGVTKLKKRVAEVERQLEAARDGQRRLQERLLETGVLRLDTEYTWAVRHHVAVAGVDVNKLKVRTDLLAEELGRRFVEIPARGERVELRELPDAD